MRHFYAEYCPYGVNAGGDARYWFKAFETKSERDEFVKSHELDENNNVVWGPATRARVSQYYGGTFIVVDGQCYRDMDDYRESQC